MLFAALMGGNNAERIEEAVDRLAAAIFAVSAGFAGWKVALATGAAAWSVVLPVAALGFLLSLLLSRAVSGGEPQYRLAEFTPTAFHPIEWPELLLTEQVELLLTDADRVIPQKRRPEELLLDDILAEMGPDSRVVRLFDPDAMPTPAQLNARIERHLSGDSASNGPPDASQELYDALAELRRSLR